MKSDFGKVIERPKVYRLASQTFDSHLSFIIRWNFFFQKKKQYHIHCHTLQYIEFQNESSFTAKRFFISF